MTKTTVAKIDAHAASQANPRVTGITTASSSPPRMLDDAGVRAGDHHTERLAQTAPA